MKAFIIKFLIFFISLGTVSGVCVMIDNYHKQEVPHEDLSQDAIQEPVDDASSVKEEVIEEPKLPTYSCPNGYRLSGTTCITSVSAIYSCPDNTHDYANDDIPRDKYCINLSEGYYTDDTCPDGYGLLAEISLGSPTKYKCMPLHNKVYKCDNGYVLNGNMCTKTINATKN